MNSDDSCFSVDFEDLENAMHQKTAKRIWYEQLAAAKSSGKREEISETAMHMWQEQLAKATRHRELVEPYFSVAPKDLEAERSAELWEAEERERRVKAAREERRAALVQRVKAEEEAEERERRLKADKAVKSCCGLGRLLRKVILQYKYSTRASLRRRATTEERAGAMH